MSRQRPSSSSLIDTIVRERLGGNRLSLGSHLPSLIGGRRLSTLGPSIGGGYHRRRFAEQGSLHGCLLDGMAVPEQVRCGKRSDAGWSSPVARQAHNLKVVGSNPTPATIKNVPP